MFSQTMVNARSLAHAGTEMEKTLRRFCLRNVRDIDDSASCISWLESQTNGIYLARLRGVGLEDGYEVDHVVVVDGGRKLIWDCVERYGIRLAPGMLSYCVGDSARLEGVKELKKFEEQPVKKSGKKRKAHKMSVEKVMERRHLQRN